MVSRRGQGVRNPVLLPRLAQQFGTAVFGVAKYVSRRSICLRRAHRAR